MWKDRATSLPNLRSVNKPSGPDDDKNSGHPAHGVPRTLRPSRHLLRFAQRQRSEQWHFTVTALAYDRSRAAGKLLVAARRSDPFRAWWRVSRHVDRSAIGQQCTTDRGGCLRFGRSPCDLRWRTGDQLGAAQWQHLARQCAHGTEICDRERRADDQCAPPEHRIHAKCARQQLKHLFTFAERRGLDGCQSDRACDELELRDLYGELFLQRIDPFQPDHDQPRQR